MQELRQDVTGYGCFYFLRIVYTDDGEGYLLTKERTSRKMRTHFKLCPTMLCGPRELCMILVFWRRSISDALYFPSWTPLGTSPGHHFTAMIFCHHNKVTTRRNISTRWLHFSEQIVIICVSQVGQFPPPRGFASEIKALTGRHCEILQLSAFSWLGLPAGFRGFRFSVTDASRLWSVCTTSLWRPL